MKKIQFYPPAHSSTGMPVDECAGSIEATTDVTPMNGGYPMKPKAKTGRNKGPRIYPWRSIFLFVFLVCALYPNPHSIASNSIVLQLRWDHQFQFAGYYAAKWMGYYDEEGIDIRIKSAVTGKGILSAVKEVGGGRAHFGIGAVDILKARDEGVPLVVIASIFQHSAAGFYTRKETVIDSPADFVQLKVARRVNDLIDLELQAMLRAEGIDPEQIEPYPHKPGMDHLLAGDVDVMPGYSINIPYLAHVKGVSVKEFLPMTYGIDFYGDSLFTHQRIVQENPELVERFKRASLKGWAYALDNKEEIIERMNSELERVKTVENVVQFNRYQSEGLVRLINHPMVELGHMNPDRWKRMHYFLKLLGLVERPLDIDAFIFDMNELKQKQNEKRQRMMMVAAVGLLSLLMVMGVGMTLLRMTVRSKTRELTKSNRKLAESEKKYRELIELAQEGIWLIDKDSKTKFVNKSMANMLGYSSDEMLGKPLFDFMDQHGRLVAEENVERRKQGIKEQHDFEFIKKDGNRVYTTMATAPLSDDDGNYDGAIAGIIDITERRQAELEKARLQKQLIHAQKMESIGNLAGGIAHDFNNILASVIGFTELGLDGVKKGTDLEDNLQEVYTAAKRAKDLVGRILTFARQTDEELGPVQVGKIVEEVLSFVRSTLPATITIKQNIDSDRLIIGNATQLHQVMMNLCTNAAHAMAQNGGCIEVNLRDVFIDGDFNKKGLGLAYGDYIEIAVRDTGTGISPDIVDAIFDPYFTTKSPGEGTGMGLALVHGIIESHKGQIRVASQVGQGTVFTIYLPVIKSAAAQMHRVDQEIPTGVERILFIDDEAAIVKMGARSLEGLGYTVAAYTSGTEALERFRNNPQAFDLVISDMTMPKMTGDMLAGEIKKIRPDIPIILCTGFSRGISDEHAAEIGAGALLFKPVVKADLARTVRDVLDGRNEK